MELSVFFLREDLPSFNTFAAFIDVLLNHVKGSIGPIRLEDVPGRRMSAKVGQLNADDVLSFVVELKWKLTPLKSLARYIVRTAACQVKEGGLEGVIFVLAARFGHNRERCMVVLLHLENQPLHDKSQRQFIGICCIYVLSVESVFADANDE